MKTAYRHPAPDGFPRLRPGAHLSPDDGACLMEYVSVLAGHRFSDHPRCTDPGLATLARLVNDATTARGRQSLGQLAPALVTASPTDAVGAASLVLATLLRALEATGGSRSLERHARRALRRLRRVSDRGLHGRLARGLEVAHRHGSGRRRLIAAVEATTRLPDEEREAVLRDMLTGALSVTHPVLELSGVGIR